MDKQIELVRGYAEIEPRFHNQWTDAAKIVSRHPFWEDPFAQVLKEPEKNPDLSWSLVQIWTEQMYHGSLAFPRYVGNLVGRVRNHAAGRLLAINAAVERGYPDESRSHFLLAVDLLRTMGLPDGQIVSIPQLPESAEYIEGHLSYAKDAPLGNAIGLLGLGIETLTTEEFTLLGNAYLRTASAARGIPQDQVYRNQGYFTENILADGQHQAEFEEIAFLTWRAGELPSDLKTCMEGIKEGARYSLDLRRKFFQGIYESVK